jgi:hypothetical protein
MTLAKPWTEEAAVCRTADYEQRTTFGGQRITQLSRRAASKSMPSPRGEARM